MLERISLVEMTCFLVLGYRSSTLRPSVCGLELLGIRPNIALHHRLRFDAGTSPEETEGDMEYAA